MIEPREGAAATLDRVEHAVASLAGAKTPTDVARATVDGAARALGASVAAVIMPIDERSLRTVASTGESSAFEAHMASFPIDADVPGAKAFRARAPEWMETREAFVRAYPALAASPGMRPTGAFVVLPLLVEDAPVGSLVLRWDGDRAFSPADRAAISMLAAVAAHALRRAQLLATESAATRRLDVLAGLADALARAVTHDEVARVVVDRGRRAMSGDSCTLYALDESDGALVLIGEAGVVPEVAERIRRFPADSPSPTARAFRERRSLWTSTEAAYHALYPDLAKQKATGPRARSFWCVPLVVEDRPIGLLGMGFYDEREFSAEERAFVETFCRQCAQALRRAERFERARMLARSLTTTLRSIGDAVIATDAAGLVTFMNPVSEALTGFAEADARGRPLDAIFRIVDAQTREPVESPVARVLREGKTVGLANHTTLLGRAAEVPIDDSAAPIRDESDAVTGVVLVFRDVTTKKQAEQRRAFLADASRALASSLDYHATLQRAAELTVPRLADYCAIDVIEEADAPPRTIAVAHVDPAKVEVALRLRRDFRRDPNAGGARVARTGVSEIYEHIPAEAVARTAESEEHARLLASLELCSAMIVPITSRGRIIGALTLFYAESKRRYAKDDLAFAEDFASRAGAAIDKARMYAAEQRARAEADRANRAKDAFLATVSHELRTPLNAILGWARLLTAGGLDDAKRGHAAQVIERNAAAMAQLIDDLLDVSRIISGKLRLEVREADLGVVVRAAIESLRPASDAKGVSIDAEFETTGPLTADPGRLQQIVWNLLSNAVKFTTKSGRVRVHTHATETETVIAVSDDGKGIDPRFLPHVFEPFRQADGSITRAHGGLGLGLAITRQLVELHGGTIRAESDGEGRGATFTVELPHAAPARAHALRSATHADEANRAELDGVKVLVVDDDEDARFLIAAILEAQRATVTTAASVAEALAALDRALPDVVVSDIGMPGEDGFVFIERLRARPKERGGELPAIALTAYAAPDDKRAVLASGYAAHVGKPVEPALLVATLKRLLP